MKSTKCKQILALILTLTLMLTAIPLTALPASAATSGDFDYGVISETDKTCKITKYNGSAEELEIPSQLDGYTVTEIDNYWDSNVLFYFGAFSNCTSLKSVTIGNGVTSIGEEAFRGCTSLVSITIPDSVTSIGEEAFYNCTSLTSITIPDSVTSIGWFAFDNCTSLTSITIPDSVTYIGYEAFSNTAYYNKEANWENGVLYIGNHLIEAKEDISGEYQIKQGTKTIANSAFSSCTSLTSITIPNSVTSIGEYAFGGCTSLTSVTIGSGVTSISNRAFYNCKSLTSVTIPDSVTYIGYEAFRGCTSLTSITIPDSVTNIGSGAFEDCASLTSITIPDSVTSIGSSAFEGCTSLTSITIPDSVTSIGYDTFSDTAYYNNEANWENGVLYIGNHLIKAKTNISGDYQIKQETKTIAGWTFYECKSLTSITIPDSVTSIGDCVFNDTAYYDNEDNWENGVLYIGNHLIEAKWNIASGSYQIKKGTKAIADDAFRSCENLTGITIPSGVTSIGDSAFEDCTSLKSVAIPSSVKSVGECAFEHCSSLTGITIGNGVTSIGSWAFYGCPSVTSVTIPSSVTEIGYKAFGYSLNYDTWNIERVAGFTISCDKGSEAQSYARSNGFKFVDLQTGASTLPGDVNGDGKVSAVDARWALQCAAKKRDLTAEQAAAADVNGDGKISAVDARQILKFAAGKI